MKIKRIVCILLSLIMVVSGFLVGCSSDNSNGSGDKGAESASGVNYPTKTIELVVPAAAGGATDLAARIFAKHATEKLGKSVVVVNVTGGGGSNGTREVHGAAPDGYKVLFFHNSVLTNNVTEIADYNHTGFEVGPSMVKDGTGGFFVNANSDIKTIHDLIDKAKANPGQIKAATEYGAYTYFMLLKFQEEFGVEFNLVDVGGNAEKVTALLGGHIDLNPNLYGSTKAYLESGDFVALGFPTEERQEVAPDIPTYKEQGVDFLYDAYHFGFFFPKGTPKEIVDVFDNVVKEIIEEDEFKKDVANIGVVVDYRSPQDYTAKLDELLKMYNDLADLAVDVN